jgi:hypothetical protein
MAKRKMHHKKKMTIPLAVVGGFLPTAVGVWNRRSSGSQVASYLQAGFTGIGADGKFAIGNLATGLGPVMAGFAVHKVASMLGVNRAMARANIPLIRI